VRKLAIWYVARKVLDLESQAVKNVKRQLNNNAHMGFWGFSTSKVVKLIKSMPLGCGTATEIEEGTGFLDRTFIKIETERPGSPKFLVQGNHLGSGCFGDVYAVYDIATGESGVFKQARIQGYAKKAVEDVQNEHEVLRALNPEGREVGLQLPSRHYVTFEKDGMSVEGYIGEIYDGDIADVSFSNKEAMQACLSQITKGLQTLHKKGYAHGDIKRENIFYRTKGMRFDLADMGGVRPLGFFKEYFDGVSRVIGEVTDLDEKKELVGLIIDNLTGVYTPGYLVLKDLEKMEEIMMGSMTGNPWAEIHKLIEARDVYALAMTMKEASSGFSRDLTEGQKEILASAVSLDYLKRPTAAALSAMFP
jgi:serine/threonine protein kinase